MPLIEELPVTATVRASHGWAYVPDSGPIAAVQPGNRDRKRAVVGRGPNSVSASLKLQKAIQQRVDSLDKENYKDGVPVPIPPRPAGRDKQGKKMTSNVRRILTYQRGFAHYLADEEANAASGTSTTGASSHTPAQTNTMPPPSAPASAQRTDSKSKRNTSTPSKTESPVTPRPGRGRRGRPPGRKNAPKTTPVKDEDTEMAEAPEPETPADDTPAEPAPAPARKEEPSYDPAWDRDPLLKSLDVPKMPSERVMKALLAEPPLSYNAARAKASPEELARPKRRFCAMCGYWGRVKCRKCEDFTCGIMECWRNHEASCPMANVY